MRRRPARRPPAASAAGPVLVPFGGAWHDWAALELGAWIARATDAPLRLIGAAADRASDGHDASRLLADASLIVQRPAGIVAEPLLAPPGRKGVMALAEGAGLLVVGLSERWRAGGPRAACAARSWRRRPRRPCWSAGDRGRAGWRLPRR